MTSSGLGQAVDVEESSLRRPAVGLEEVVELVIESCEEIPNSPLGTLDRDEDRRFGQVKRLMGWMDLTFESEEWLASYRLGRDYQQDHPISSVDRILDRAFIPAGSYTAIDVIQLEGLVDDLAMRRLRCYSVRCAARALMTGRVALVEAGQRAYAWTVSGEGLVDPRDEMVSLAPLHFAGSSVGLSDHPLEVLHDLASGFPDSAQTILAFSGRFDITLSEFGWDLLRTGHGTWIVSTL